MAQDVQALPELQALQFDRVAEQVAQRFVLVLPQVPDWQLTTQLEPSRNRPLPQPVQAEAPPPLHVPQVESHASQVPVEVFGNEAAGQLWTQTPLLRK